MSDINDDEEIKQEIKKEIKPSTVVKTKKKKREGTLRKAPQAPKRFKSSYIIFFMAKQEEIKKGLNSSGSLLKFPRKRLNFGKHFHLKKESIGMILR